MRQFVGIVAPLRCLLASLPSLPACLACVAFCRGVHFVGRDDCTGLPMTTLDDGFYCTVPYPHADRAQGPTAT